MARNHTDITQLEEVDMREVAQKPCLNLEGIIEESCLEPINSDDYWLFKCRIERTIVIADVPFAKAPPSTVMGIMENRD